MSFWKELYIIFTDLSPASKAIEKGLVMMMERNMFGIGSGRKSFESSGNKEEFEAVFTRNDPLPNQMNSPLMSSFLPDLIQHIKNTLGSLKNYTQLSKGKFNDREFGEYYYRAVTEDIEKIDMVLSGLTNYVKLNTPIQKTNTVHHIIEEVLKRYQAKLDEKGIRLLKKFERDLPETIVPDEQLKYIISSVLQYAMASSPPHWTIGLSTRSVVLEKGGGEVDDLFKRDGKYIEFSVAFPGYKKPIESVSGIKGFREEEASDLILRFVKEVVQLHRGTLRMGADEKKTKTFISIRFPVERRKVVYYQPAN